MMNPEALRAVLLAFVVRHEVDTTGDTDLGGLPVVDDGEPAANDDPGPGPETDVPY